VNSGEPARSLEASCERDPRGDRTSRITWRVRYADLDEQGKLIYNIINGVSANDRGVSRLKEVLCCRRGMLARLWTDVSSW
jgi:hypothetical protein